MKATVNDFVFKVNIPEDNFQFGLPFYLTAPVNIDWGDGTTDVGVIYYHTYERSGEYELVISKEHPQGGILFEINVSSATRIYVTAIVQWGTDLVTLGQSCLSGYTNLVSLPSGTSGVRFNSTTYRSGDFRDCQKLTSIPSDFYNNNTNSPIVTLENLFYGCSSLTSFPSLSRFSSTVTYVSGLFQHCTSLRTFTSSLFSGFNQLNQINVLFNGCTGLTSVGRNIFSGCSAVTTINGLFSDCTSLSEIPADIFNPMTELQYTYRVFYNAGLTTVPADIFRYNNKIISFNNCFSNLTKLSSSARTPNGTPYGNIELWDRASNPNFPNSISGSGCFTNSKFQNIGSVPVGWK